MLDRFGRDLTREAMEGKLRPVVGRDEEIQALIETLCRQTKRNPCLVGPAGVGKTAIVEGFAQRVVRGEVPEVLRGVRVLAVQPSSLVAGAHVVGELEKRMQALLSEASQDGIVLFIDEVHSMVGAGGMVGTDDVATCSSRRWQGETLPVSLPLLTMNTAALLNPIPHLSVASSQFAFRS